MTHPINTADFNATAYNAQKLQEVSVMVVSVDSATKPDVNAELLEALKEVVSMHDNDRAVREKHIDVLREIISRAEQKCGA